MQLAMRRLPLASAGVLLIAGLAAGCAGIGRAGVGSTLSPPPSAPTTAAIPQPSATTAPGDAATAGALVDAYERALVAGQWAVAWTMLSPSDQAARGSLASFSAERAAFYRSVGGRFALSPPTHDPRIVASWVAGSRIASGANLARGFVVQVTYPALAGNNAGFDIFLAAPDMSGTWRIWVLR